jgi:hypothetical protein
MTHTTLTPEQMERRTARFHKLETYQRQNFGPTPFRPARWKRWRRAASIR